MGLWEERKTCVIVGNSEADHIISSEAPHPEMFNHDIIYVIFVQYQICHVL